MNTILRVSDVKVGYGLSDLVLDGVSFDVPHGVVLGVLGRNGMGKSTLLSCIAGLLTLRSGNIILGDTDISRLPAYRRSRLGMSLVIQDRGMFGDLTVAENLQMARLGSRRGSEEMRDYVLDRFPHIAERLKQKARTLSGGEQQMVAIGRALMTNPTLLLLDEPSDGVMPSMVDEIGHVLTKIVEDTGVTVILVEQNVPLVRRTANNCILLNKGQIVASGKLDDLEREGELERYMRV